MRKKVSKTEWVLLALTVVFLCVLAGLYTMDKPAATAGTYTITTERSPETAVTPEARYININTATAAELTELNGVGEVIAQRIVDYRAAHGPFASVEQLMEVKGIGEAKLEDMRGSITLDGSPPVQTELETGGETP